MPYFYPNGGQIMLGTPIKVKSTTPGAVLCYERDPTAAAPACSAGKDSCEKGTMYKDDAAPTRASTDTNKKWRAIACLSGWENSDVLEMPTTILPSPTLSSISGCDVNGNHARHCRDGKTITIKGSNFDPVHANQHDISFHGGEGTTPTCVPTLSSATEVECTYHLADDTAGVWELQMNVHGVRAEGAATIEEATAPAPGFCPDGGLHADRSPITFLTYQNAVICYEADPAKPVPKCSEDGKSCATGTLFDAAKPPKKSSKDNSNKWRAVQCPLGYKPSPVAEMSKALLPTPILSKVEGCEHNGIRATGCESGSTITIRGSGFDPVDKASNELAFVIPAGTDAPLCPITKITLSLIECTWTPPKTNGKGPWSIYMEVHDVPAESSLFIDEVWAETPHFLPDGGKLADGTHLYMSSTPKSLICYQRTATSPAPECSADKKSCKVGEKYDAAAPPVKKPSDANQKFQATACRYGMHNSKLATMSKNIEATPTVGEIQGCDINGAHASGCKDGSMLIITGTNFEEGVLDNHKVTFVGTSGPVPTCEVKEVTKTEIKCVLKSQPGDWVATVNVHGADAVGSLSYEDVKKPTPHFCPDGDLIDDLEPITIIGEGLICYERDPTKPAPSCNEASNDCLTGTKYDKVKRPHKKDTDNNNKWRAVVCKPGYRPSESIEMSSPVLPAVVITKLTGCEKDGAHAQGCPRGGNTGTITVHGENFDPTSNSKNVIKFSGGEGSEPTCVVTAVAPTLVECTLTKTDTTLGSWTVKALVHDVVSQGGVTLESKVLEEARFFPDGGELSDGTPITIKVHHGATACYETDPSKPDPACNAAKDGCASGTKYDPVHPQKKRTLDNTKKWRAVSCLMGWSNSPVATMTSAVKPAAEVTGIEGCVTNGMHLRGCHDADVLTVKGVNFDEEHPDENAIKFSGGEDSCGNPSCPIISVKSTEIKCNFSLPANCTGLWVAETFVHGVLGKGTPTLEEKILESPEFIPDGGKLLKDATLRIAAPSKSVVCYQFNITQPEPKCNAKSDGCAVGTKYADAARPLPKPGQKWRAVACATGYTPSKVVTMQLPITVVRGAAMETDSGCVCGWFCWIIIILILLVVGGGVAYLVMQKKRSNDGSFNLMK
eukprot:NODE_16_length_3923_cov_433.521425_g14_i0.p1 GENE.NODE_16_length_3923_cov_433.521425_g14_i0~~NODE_16_length_3923_cov_433.521425_g14_i0.p1  ORF type:complete len:1237 (+),score=355.38 NODE_16_length_3923_cov_433.521425_g14_i0:350-3712(+)